MSIFQTAVCCLGLKLTHKGPGAGNSGLLMMKSAERYRGLELTRKRSGAGNAVP